MALCAMITCFLSACVNDPDESVWSLSQGDAIPAFSVVTSEGSTISRELLEGHWAVLVFFNTSCNDCRRELPELQKAFESIKANPDIELLCISRSEDAASVSAYWSSNSLSMPWSAQSDRRVYDMFASSGIPRTYVINPAGYITATFAPEDKLTAGMLLAALPE